MFLGILRKQLVLKGIITEQDWEEWKDDIYIDYVKDNHFTELKEMEIYRERAGLLNEMVGFVGEYISKEWAMRNILRLSDDDMEQMKKEMEGEISSGEVPDPQEEPEEEEPKEQKPMPVKVVPDDEPKEKKERYIPSNNDELTEELTRYMAKLNEQD